MLDTDPAPPASPSPPPTASGIASLSLRTIPRDGGTLLAGAAALGVLSFFSHLEQVHLGPGPIPMWVPLALDAVIAGACGGVLAFGSRWFTEDEPPDPDNYVVVAKPVWESVQREIVEVRAHAGPVLPAPAPPAVESPHSVEIPIVEAPAAESPHVPVLAATPLLNPWDEGPPMSSGSPPPHPTGHATAFPAPRPSASPAPTGAAELTASELEEIARMGGILGIVPRPGETGQQYSKRLAEAREAMAKPAPPIEPIPFDPTTSASEPDPATKGTADIDELMGWLEKMVADPPGAPMGTPPKKQAPKEAPSESGASSQ